MRVTTDTAIPDHDLIAHLTPVQIIALTIWGEARSGTSRLRRAIADVIANRLRAKQPEWGLTLSAVCLHHGQFSCWSPAGGGGNASNYADVMLTARHLLDGKFVGPILRECLAIATTLMHDAMTDDVKGANHYYAPAAMVPPDRVPEWAVNQVPTALIDGTRFYKLEVAA